MSTSGDARFRVHKSYHKAAAVVLDLGTRYTRIGFAGEPHPRHTIPTPSHVSSLDSTPSHLPASSLTAHYASVLSPYLRHLCFHLLLINPRDRRVLLLESPFLPLPYRLALTSVLSSLHSPALCFLPSSLAGYLPCSLPSATVVDVGWQDTRICGVTHGIPLLAHLTTTPTAMCVVVHHMRDAVLHHPANAALTGRMEAEVDERMWEDLVARAAFVDDTDDDGVDASFTFRRILSSYVDFASSSFVPSAVSSEAMVYAGPGGGGGEGSAALVVSVPAKARRHAAMALFEEGEESLSSLIASHIASLPIDLRRPLSRVVLVGGGSHIPGLARYLQARMDREGKAKVRVEAAEGGEAAWRGGSIMAGVLDGDDGWMSQDDMRAYVAAARDGRTQRVEMEDWLWPLGQRVAVNAKEVPPSASVFVQRTSVTAPGEAAEGEDEQY